MPGENELLIKINADAKNAKKAFDDVKDQTEDLQSALNKASLVGAAVFAALSVEVAHATSEFINANQASLQLTNALQNQGIFTTKLREDYKAIAEELSKKTGIDDDQITKSLAVAQSYLGQTKISKELAAAIVDLGDKLGSTDQAAQLIGRSIGTTTNALARNGVAVREGSTEAERYKQVLEGVNGLVRGNAAASNEASLGLKGLKTSFGNLQEEIGSKLAPAVRTVAKFLTELFDKIRENKPLVEFGVAIGVGVAAAAALVAIAAPTLAAITTITAALAALGVAGGAAVLIIGGIPLVVASAVAALTFLAVGSEETKNKIKASFLAIGEFIKSALSGDSGKEAYANAMREYDRITKIGQDKIAATTKEGEEKQNQEFAAAAAKRNAEKQRIANLEAQQLAVSTQIKLAQLREESQEIIKLRQEELAILKNLETEKSAVVIAASRERLIALRNLQIEQQVEDIQQAQEFAATKQEVLAELQAEGYTNLNALSDQQLDTLRTQKQTELDVETQVAKDRLSQKIASDNLYLADQKKFGVAYAAINQAMHSAIYQGSKQAFGELAQLQTSSNSTLKGIGKVAAIANIVIRTAESAMNIFAGFSAIPIVGPTLGLAGAAAAVAFGAEQVGRVNSAATGALVGGTGNTDNQPFMLTPGELVAPRRNFNEVVDGVQTERSGIIEEIREKLGALSSGAGGQTVNVTVQGDMLAEDSYIEKLADAFGKAIQFRNVNILGVTA